MRAFAAVPVAIVVCAAAPAFADASSHVKAARTAEKKNQWRKALQEWKAAYAAEPNAEYLIGIGDAQAHLGNKAEAKKSYEAYLADPLALPGNAQKVKAKLAKLQTPQDQPLALPGPGLTLPGAAAATTKKADAPLPLPGLDLPDNATAAKGSPPPLPLPGPEPVKKDEKVASAAPLPLALPLPGATPPKTEPPRKQAAAAGAASAATAVAVTTPAKPVDKAPAAAVTAAAPMPVREAQPSSGVQRTMAYVTAGVAVLALGGGALAFTKASSAHDDLTSQVHSGQEAQHLLETEKSNKTLAFVGFAGGLVAAGVATALFAF
ncbi:MAG TPA: hypothetical protein VMK66_00750 [Myxococcales bacterium]|nr:hypothetical protein [Myxococcales bacterium]